MWVDLIKRKDSFVRGALGAIACATLLTGCPSALMRMGPEKIRIGKKILVEDQGSDFVLGSTTTVTLKAVDENDNVLSFDTTSRIVLEPQDGLIVDDVVVGTGDGSYDLVAGKELVKVVAGLVTVTLRAAYAGTFTLKITNGAKLINPDDLSFIVTFSCSIYANEIDHTVSGSGTKADPYKICNAAQLNNLGATSSDWDKHFILMDNIDMSAYTGTDFNIIGSSATPFTGSFDGNDKTISNFTYTDAATDYIGIFGYVEKSWAEIKDFTMSSVNVTGQNYTGAAIGYVSRAFVSNISVASGAVTGNNYTGGIIGSSTTVLMSYLKNAATISGANQTGGVLGSMHVSSDLRHSYSTGTVSGSTNVGGLVGYGNGGSHIKGSFATGSVTGTETVGGLAGYHWYLHLFDNFAANNVTGNAASDSVGPMIGSDVSILSNNYYDDDKTCDNQGSGSCNTRGDLVSGDPTYFYTSSNPPLSSWDFTNDWATQTNDYPIHNIVTLDESSWGTCADHATDTPFAGGVGTMANPYLICSATQLDTIGTSATYNSKYFKIMDDIDMTSISDFNIIADGSTFKGTFNGNGKTISNLTFNNAGTNEQGFIAMAEYTWIYDLRLTDLNITGSSSVGGIVGILGHNSVLYKVSTSGSVSGVGRVGGLVGYGYINTRTYNSFSTATVTGTGDEVGGLVGDYWSAGTIEYCYSKGAVTGVNRVGGIIGGDAVYLNYSFTRSPVDGSGTNIGPVRGYGATIDTSYYDDQALCNNCDNTEGSDIDTSASPNYFYTSSSTPLSSWDFNTVWQANASSEPTFR